MAVSLEMAKDKKQSGHKKSPRMLCTVCFKGPAVRYINKKTGIVTYEHRDEPPIREFFYRNEKHKRYTYRQCQGSKPKSLEQILEPVQKPNIEAKSEHKAISVITKEKAKPSYQELEQMLFEERQKRFEAKQKLERIRHKWRDFVEEVETL